MTKVQVHYVLEHPLTDEQAEGVARVHGVYGIARVWVATSLDKLTVDFDASRLSEKDVEAELVRNGIPVKREPIMATEVTAP
jgi:hypothetical protein